MKRLCPECDAWVKTRVLATQRMAWGTYRRVECVAGHRFATEELLKTRRRGADGTLIPRPQPKPKALTNDAGAISQRATIYGLTRAEREHLRGLYIAWKQQHKVGANGSPLHEDPTLRAAFGRAITDHGYGYTDIAEWLGITRERVRQLVNKMGIADPGVRMRIWDDECARFVPVSGVEYRRRCHRAQAPRRRMAKQHRNALRWDRARTVILELRAQLGRTPYAAEIMKPLGFPDRQVGRISSWLVPTRTSHEHVRVMDELYATAGLFRPEGRRSIRNQSNDKEK